MMKTNTYIVAILATALAIVASSQQAFAQKAKIGIQPVSITDAVRDAARHTGTDQVNSLERVAQSLQQQLIDRVHNTRKFTVVSRSDLDTILKDQDLQRLVSDPSDPNIAHAFKISGCQYGMMVTIDAFQDLEERRFSEGGNVTARKRTINLSSVLKLYEVETGEVVETATFSLTRTAGMKQVPGAEANGKAFEPLLGRIAREMAQDTTTRVIDVIYPAKLLRRTGNIVTINRGDGTGIARGQTWTVYGLGVPLIDPDTGENLGSEGTSVGRIEITNVKPKTSQGHVLEDHGIAQGQVLRMDDSVRHRQDDDQ